jgi:hypothetical protein
MSTSTAGAQDQPSLLGRWEGEIQLPGTPLAIEVEFGLDEDALSGSISIPVEGAFDLPLDQIQRDAHDVAFRMADAPGEPRFRGRMADDGDSIHGDFRQNGQTFGFRLDRTAVGPREDRSQTAGADETEQD